MQRNSNLSMGTIAAAARKKAKQAEQVEEAKQESTTREWSVHESTDEGQPDWHWYLGGNLLDGTKTQRCCASSRSSGGVERCRQTAIKGTTVCRHHGGQAPNVQASIQRRQTEEEVAQVINATRRKMRLGEGPVEDRDPALVLNDLLATVRGDLLALRQAAMTVDLTDAEQDVSHRAMFITGLYGQWLDRAQKMAESLVKISQNDRSLNMAESLSALERIERARDLGLDDETRDAAIVLAKAMRNKMLTDGQQPDTFDVVPPSDEMR